MPTQPPTCSPGRTVGFPSTRVSGSRSSTATCRATFSRSSIACDTAPGRHGARRWQRRQAARRRHRQAHRGRARCRRLLRRPCKAPLARHLADRVGKADATGGEGVSTPVPSVRRRYPAQRRRPAGAGSREVRGSQAGEGQDAKARVKLVPHAPRRTARTAANLPRSRAAHRLGRTRSGPRRSRRLPGITRRAARDRHPQPLTAAGREGTTKPPGGPTPAGRRVSPWSARSASGKRSENHGPSTCLPAAAAEPREKAAVVAGPNGEHARRRRGRLGEILLDEHHVGVVLDDGGRAAVVVMRAMRTA